MYLLFQPQSSVTLRLKTLRKFSSTSLPAQVMFCYGEVLTGDWKVSGRWGEEACRLLPSPPPSSRSTPLATAPGSSVTLYASLAVPSDSSLIPGQWAPSFKVLVFWQYYLFHLPRAPRGGSCFLQFLTSGSLQHSLCALSALQYFGNQFPVTNPWV